MKNILLIFFGTFLLTNCNTKQAEVKIDNNTSIQLKDNALNDTVREKPHRIFINPFKDINNFDITFGDRFIDSLHAAYTSQEHVKATLTKDICIGDNCESYKTIVNTQKNTRLYLFKGDGSEYGFSNDQYLLNNDSLIYVRNFNVQIESWPKDSTDTQWKIEEVVYRFQDNPPYIKTRTVITKDLDKFDFTLRGVKGKVINNFDTKKLFNEKSLELRKLLEMKESEYRD